MRQNDHKYKDYSSASANVNNTENSKAILCENLGFAGAEAYKLLRTNIMFSLPDNGKCRRIGITSSIRSENKTTTAINLAYTMAQTGKKVLLIEGDMRLPNIAKNLGLKKAPGLSNLLVGLATAKEVIQRTQQHKDLYVITAGDIPPNPSELIASSKMSDYFDAFSEIMDFIILDLPPIGIVSDALVASNILDGLLFVVRQDYTNKRELNDSMYTLSVAKAKVLGFVMTHSTASEKGYRYRRVYKKGYYRYGKNYGYSGYGHYGSNGDSPTSEEGTNV